MSILSAQDNDTYTKKVRAVKFDYHNAEWTFEETFETDEPRVFYNVFFNAMGVIGYEFYESDEKKSICKVYYNSVGNIEKWEIFNGRKISQTAKFFYENGELSRIDEYEHKGKVNYLAYKHYYDNVRVKLEVFEYNELRREFHYWTNGEIKIEGNYKDGKKDGYWIYRDRLFGRVEKREEYYNGELIVVTKFEYGEYGQKTKRTLIDDNGNVHTTIYKYNLSISTTDPVEIRQYTGTEEDGELQSITIAEFDKKTDEFIAMVKYNAKCEIKSISIIYYPEGPDSDGMWYRIKDTEKINDYLSSFNFESSCSI
ncbi:MAG: hypothetical protein ACOCV8_04665 [Spirochaetota bacterium]